MEKPHQEYRDNLAHKLKEIRDDGPESEDPKSEITREHANKHLEAEEKTDEYKESLKLHKEDIDKIIQDKSINEKIKNIFILKAENAIEKGLLEDAVSFYKEAGTEIPKEKLMEIIGNWEKRPFLAIDAYKILGTEIPDNVFLRAADVKAESLIGYRVRGGVFMSKEWDEINWVISEYRRLGSMDKIIELAENFFKHGIFNKKKYLSVLAEMGQTDKIISLAEEYASGGLFSDMKEAYKLAGVEIPKERLLECGDKYLDRHKEQHQNDDGFYAYIESVLDIYEGAVPEAKDRLIEIGDRLIKDGRFRQAQDAYERAGVEMPKEKIIECGDALRLNGLHGHSKSDCLDLYKIAGAKDKLIEVAEEFFVGGDYKKVLSTLKDVGIEIPKEKLLEWADAIGRNADIEHTIEVYKLIGIEIPKEKLVEYGDILFKIGKSNPVRIVKYSGKDNPDNLIYSFEEALKAYNSAGAKEKMTEVADAYLALGSTDIAMEWYFKIKGL